jgi:hypothetical protein
MYAHLKQIKLTLTLTLTLTVQVELESLVRYLNASGEIGEIVELGDDDLQVLATLRVLTARVYMVIVLVCRAG